MTLVEFVPIVIYAQYILLYFISLGLLYMFG